MAQTIEIYIKPYPITNLTVTGENVYFLTSNTENGYKYAVSNGLNITISADGYISQTVTAVANQTYTLVLDTPKYISNISDGINIYTIKDSEARTSLSNKQDTLVSGTNIKTINNQSILGSGNLSITDPYVKVSTSNRTIGLGDSVNPASMYAISINGAAFAGNATGIGSIVIGSSNATAIGAIQIGTKLDGGYYTNSDANTLKIGNQNGNYEMMSADGTIPNARLHIDTSPTSGSTNAISSGAVYTVLGDLESAINTIRGV